METEFCCPYCNFTFVEWGYRYEAVCPNGSCKTKLSSEHIVKKDKQKKDIFGYKEES